jgi:hypothetical protein
LIPDRRFSLRVDGWPLYYHEICCLGPLLGQSNEGRAIRCHAPD